MPKKENDIGGFLECKVENKNVSGMEAQKNAIWIGMCLNRSLKKQTIGKSNKNVYCKEEFGLGEGVE